MGRPKGSKNKKIQDGALGSVEVHDSEGSKYSITLLLNGKEYSSKANTLVEAIEKLNPGMYKTKGVLKVTKGEKTVTRLLFIRQMTKLFGKYGGLSKQIALQSTAKVLDMMLV